MHVCHRDTSGHSNSNRRAPLCSLHPFQAVCVLPPPLPHPCCIFFTRSQTHTFPLLLVSVPLCTQWAQGQLMAIGACAFGEAAELQTYIIRHVRSTCVCTLSPALAQYLPIYLLLPQPDSTSHTNGELKEKKTKESQRGEQRMGAVLSYDVQKCNLLSRIFFSHRETWMSLSSWPLQNSRSPSWKKLTIAVQPSVGFNCCFVGTDVKCKYFLIFFNAI